MSFIPASSHTQVCQLQEQIQAAGNTIETLEADLAEAQEALQRDDRPRSKNPLNSPLAVVDAVHVAGSEEPQAFSPPAAGAPEHQPGAEEHPGVPAADELYQEAAGGKTPSVAEPTSGIPDDEPEVQQDPSAVVIADPAAQQGEEVPAEDGLSQKRGVQGKSGHQDASTAHASSAEQEPLVGKHLEEGTTDINGTCPQKEEISEPVVEDGIPSKAPGKSLPQPQLDSTAGAAPDDKPHPPKDHSKVAADTEQPDKAVPHQRKAEVCATLSMWNDCGCV